MSPRPSLRGTRLDLARVFADGPRTAYEASKALGKPTGSIFGLVKRMHAEGLLLADTDVPGRGTQYTLSPETRDSLVEALSGENELGTVVEGQRLLLVERPEDPIEAQRIFARRSSGMAILWAAEVGAGWLLALNTGLGGSYPCQLLELELKKKGISCQPLTLTGLLSGRELRDRADWLLEELETPP